MGDHGPRYGKLRDTNVGRFEDNNSSMFFIVPEKIRANKEIMWTLQENSKQLISHYDLYVTLVDIVRAQPGGGRFWGYFHAKYDKCRKPSYELISKPMPRFNAYGGQECSELHPTITPYCYCRDEKNLMIPSWDIESIFILM